MNKFETMSKEDLRSACKEVGIKYGKMNNTEMRQALSAVQAATATGNDKPKSKAAKKVLDKVAKEVEQIAQRDSVDEIFADLAVPRDAPVAPKGFSDAELGLTAPVRGVTVLSGPAAAKASKKGLKIEKDREAKNGVKRPSIGGACRLIWDALDARVAIGSPVDAKVVKELAVANGWNPNNASIEFYQWRKFNGITSKK